MKKNKKSNGKKTEKSRERTLSSLAKRQGKTIHLLQVKHAKTLGQRFRGLMGVKQENFDYALVFHLSEKGRMSASIHMLFMKMPIDVLFLDENKKIVDLVKNLKPWTINYTPKAEAKYIVELPAQAIEKNGIKIREKVEWQAKQNALQRK